jgi:hypothetical protein
MTNLFHSHEHIVTCQKVNLFMQFMKLTSVSQSRGQQYHHCGTGLYFYVVRSHIAGPLRQVQRVTTSNDNKFVSFERLKSA